MNLKKFILKNFRCYEHLEVEIQDLNAFIGKNDVGKSTILEALDVFFNSKPSKSDLKIGSIEPLELICVFNNLPNEVILDDTATTTLANEFLLNEDGDLEIIKKYTGTTLTEKIFIKCIHPDAKEHKDLLNLKKPSLKIRARELEVDLKDVNKNINKEIRQAIRNKFHSDVILQEVQVEGGLNNEDNRKKIYSSLQRYLPIYSLFKVDKELNDGDEDIQNPMKTVVSKVLREDSIFKMLEDIKEKVRIESTKEADRIVEKLKDIDRKLAEKLKSTFPKEPAWNSIFKLNLENENGVPLNNRGSGIRRLVLLSFFQAQVDKAIIENENSPSAIYALEEPETSQHPNHQLLIIKALIELSQTNNSQVLFTTHNSNLAQLIPKSSLRYIFVNEVGKIIIENGVNSNGEDNEEILDKIIQTLGILPDPSKTVKIILSVEGPNDISFLNNISKILNRFDKTIIDLEEEEKKGTVIFNILGGGNLKHHVENLYFRKFRIFEYLIVDRDDDGKYIEDAEKMKNKENSHSAVTSKLMMENYIHPEAIKEHYETYNDFLQEEINYNNFNTEENYISDLVSELKRVGFSRNKNYKIKNDLNSLVVKKMTVDMLKEIDGYDEIKSWLDFIKSQIEKQ